MEYAIDPAGPKEQFAVNCRGVTKTYGTGDTGVMALRGIDSLPQSWIKTPAIVTCSVRT